MVYPERLELDSLIKPNAPSPGDSWCNESQPRDLQGSGQQLHSTGERMEGCSLDEWMGV
jgi:hypothetical protein